MAAACWKACWDLGDAAPRALGVVRVPPGDVTELVLDAAPPEVDEDDPSPPVQRSSIPGVAKSAKGAPRWRGRSVSNIQKLEHIEAHAPSSADSLVGVIPVVTVGPLMAGAPVDVPAAATDAAAPRARGVPISVDTVMPLPSLGVLAAS
jgi:hypothetical protein